MRHGGHSLHAARMALKSRSSSRAQSGPSRVAARVRRCCTATVSGRAITQARPRVGTGGAPWKTPYNRGACACTGGFNIPIGPGFSPLRLVWLKELGACYVSASIRGGGEYGAEWHAGGKLFNKQNVFDDFCASAEHLIKAGITTKGGCALANPPLCRTTRSPLLVLSWMEGSSPAVCWVACLLTVVSLRWDRSNRHLRWQQRRHARAGVRTAASRLVRSRRLRGTAARFTPPSRVRTTHGPLLTVRRCPTSTPGACGRHAALP